MSATNCAWCGEGLRPGEVEICDDCLTGGLPNDRIAVDLADDIVITEHYWAMSPGWLESCRQVLLLAEQAGAQLAEVAR